MKQEHKVALFHTDTPDMTGLEDVDLVPAREIFDYSDSFLASARPQVFADIFRLPKDSPALNELIACFSDPAYVPEWLPKRALSKVMALPKDERLLGASEIITPLLGPRALTHMLIKHDEDQNAVPFEMLNPVPWVLNDAFFNPHGGFDFAPFGLTPRSTPRQTEWAH